MENSLLVGLSRQAALARELNVVANNIANLNTAGFKTDNALFERFLIAPARDTQFAALDQPINFVRDRATWRDLTQGSIQQTGNPLDVAIDGAGFLVVQTPRGERYTRNGSMQVNAQGQVVTSEGFTVLGDNGPIVLQPLDRNVAISPDGRISVSEGGDSRTESLRGKLRLVTFANPQALLKDGSTLFSAPEGVASTPAQNVRVVQGAVEKSNVHGVLEMTRMVEITRAYTQIASLLQQQNELQRTAIERLAEVPT